MGKRKTKRGKTAKNARKGVSNIEPEEIVKAPHSFVINRGTLGKNGHDLLLNFRKIMEPYTASQLKVQKQNVLKDFVHMAGPLNVTHLIVFTKTQNALYLRIAKLPHGPTLTYEVKEYSLMKDIISSQKKSVMYEKLFDHPPLLVLNNFSGEGMHMKLMATTFQHMFPSINVNKTNLNVIRRCLLLNYNADKTLDFRQYAIKVVPTGISKAVKKLIQSKVPNLCKFQEIEDFLDKSANLSESEAEIDGAANTVTLPQPISSRGNIASEKSAIRLYEIGPRLTLQLIKIEEGLMTGEILFHEYVTKTPEEIQSLKKKLKAKKLLKEKRKAEQQRNVERKLAEKEKGDEQEDTQAGSEDEREEDLNWYRKDVGEEPDESLLPMSRKRKSTRSPSNKPVKRVKFSKDSDKKKQTEIEKKPDKSFQAFFKKRKQRKEAKSAKQKARKASNAVLALRAKHGENKKRKHKKK